MTTERRNWHLTARGGHARHRRGLTARTAFAAAATLLCTAFGLGAVALSGAPSGAATTATLYVDNVNGTAITGCTSSGTGACETIQEGVNAAEALSDTSVTLDVAGSATIYHASVMIDLLSAGGDSLNIQGTGSTPPTLDSEGSASNITIETTSVGAVSVDQMTISGGHAMSSTESGGGIEDLGSGLLSVSDDTFSDNTAGDHGGAIDVGDGCVGEGDVSGDLDVTQTTMNGNSAGDAGPAIDAGDCSGSSEVTMSDSTVSGNTGNSFAVEIWTEGTVTNSTFAANDGGGLEGNAIAITNDTFTANAVGAVSDFDNGSVANSILDDPGAPECEGSPTDGGYNVSIDDSCGFGSTSIQNSTTIGTLTLAANGSGGPQTAAITTSSSAHNLVPLSACTPTSDERGLPRPGLGYTACDAGAYETQKSTGYDLAGADGGVFVFPTGQSSGYYGSLPGLGVKVNNVVGLVPTNNYTGYDLAGSDGGVFVFPTGQGSGYYGSLPGLGVKVSNVVGLVPTNNDHGYDLVGSDGGVFVFPTGQSSGFYGSLPGLGVKTNDIVGLVAEPGGGGYLLAGKDGGVFAFGTAKYYGSLPGSNITANNIVGITSTPDGKGYYLVSSNGTVYPFGDAVGYGTLPKLGVTVSNIVSIVPTATGAGYWLIGADGGVFAFGDAGFINSLPGLGVHVNNVVGAVPTLF